MARRRGRLWTNLGFLLWVAVAALVGGLFVESLTDLDDPEVVVPDADLRNGRSFIQDNLWSTETDQYAVWVAPDGTPYAGKRGRNGTAWQTVDLGRAPGNPLGAPTADDEHNVYVIAVDALGYVHIAGNMHSSPLRYIRSERPGDITSWKAGTVAGPTAQVTYPQFAALPDGSLLFFRREGVAGDGAILLDVLPAGARTWRHVGTVLDGRPTGESPYLHRVAVDARTGKVHLMFEWRGDLGHATNNDVQYVRSRDGGVSWETSEGRHLPIPVTHGSAETVLDTAPSGSGISNGGGLAVDTEGHPHGVVRADGTGPGSRLLHLWHDGGEWQHQELDGSLLAGRPAVAALPDGSVWLLGARGAHLDAVEIGPGGPGDRHTLGVVPTGWEATYDGQALALDGIVEILVPDGAEPGVIIHSTLGASQRT